MIDTALLDNDVLRFVLVASVVISFLVYTRFHLVAGGSVTGGFVAGLALFGHWEVILWVVLLALATALVMRVVVLRFVLFPKSIVLPLFVLVGAALGGVLLLLLPGTVESDTALWGIIAAYGALVTPGLLAYDLVNQRAVPTLVAVGVVAVLTLALVVPIALAAADLPSGYSTTEMTLATRLSVEQIWLGAFAAIALGFALKFSFGLRSGGFLGAFFLVELLTWEAFVTVGAGAVTAALAVRAARRWLILSPRQHAQISLVLGALIAWAGLYWLTTFGWDPAIQANSLAIAPLLAVGLIAADMGRPDSGIIRTGVGVGIAAVLIAALLAIAPSIGPGGAYAALAVATILIAVPGATRLWRQWRVLVTQGREAAAAIPVADRAAVPD